MTHRVRGLGRSVPAFWALVALLGCGGSGGGGDDDGGSAACPTLNAGFEIVEYQPGRRAALWYPTTEAAHPYLYPGQTAQLGQVAAGAGVADCARFPLVVFSHGDTGCGTQSIFITEEIARRGYVVIAPDHLDALCSVDGGPARGPDPNPEPGFAEPENWTDQAHVDRRDDVEDATDWALADPDLAPHIDAARLAMMGHSLGGYTALAIVGGWSRWHDPRFQAALLFSPYLTPYLETGALPTRVHVPLMYQGGTADLGVTPYIAGPTRAYPAGAYDVSNPPKYFAELSGAGHLFWTNFTCAQSASIAACYVDEPDTALLVNYGAAFLDRHLRGASEPLLDSGPGFATYESQPN
jgi:predicted dienelactone hydrolase